MAYRLCICPWIRQSVHRLQAGKAIESLYDTGNQLYKIPAVLKFWEAAASLQDAANRHGLLITAKGVEAWVPR